MSKWHLLLYGYGVLKKFYLKTGTAVCSCCNAYNNKVETIKNIKIRAF